MGHACIEIVHMTLTTRVYDWMALVINAEKWEGLPPTGSCMSMRVVAAVKGLRQAKVLTAQVHNAANVVSTTHCKATSPIERAPHMQAYACVAYSGIVKQLFAMGLEIVEQAKQACGCNLTQFNMCGSGVGATCTPWQCICHAIRLTATLIMYCNPLHSHICPLQDYSRAACSCAAASASKTRKQKLGHLFNISSYTCIVR